jgi:hypothetical protein
MEKMVISTGFGLALAATAVLGFSIPDANAEAKLARKTVNSYGT